MKACVKITSTEPTNPIQMALKVVVGLNPALQIVETPEEAELVVVNEAKTAFELLKDDEDVKVLIATLPGEYGSSVRAGVQGLTKAYPGRVFARPMIERDGEQNIVFFILGLKEEVK